MFWRRKNKKTEPEIPARKQQTSRNGFGFSLNNEGLLDISVVLPYIEDRNMMEQYAIGIANMIVKTCKTEVIPYVLTQVSTEGHNSGNTGMSNLVNIHVNRLIMESSGKNITNSFIRPSKVFSAKGDKVD
jgi:hypothetical protein